MGTPESWIIHDTGVLRAAAAASLLVVCYWLRRSSTRPRPVGDGFGGKVACDNLPYAGRAGDSQPIEQEANVFAVTHAACRNDFHREKVLRGCGYDMQEWVIENGAPSPGVRET